MSSPHDCIPPACPSPTCKAPAPISQQGFYSAPAYIYNHPGPLVQCPQCPMVSDHCTTFFGHFYNMAIWLLDQTIFAADFLPKLTRPEPALRKVSTCTTSFHLSRALCIVHTPVWKLWPCALAAFSTVVYLLHREGINHLTSSRLHRFAPFHSLPYFPCFLLKILHSFLHSGSAQTTLTGPCLLILENLQSSNQEEQLFDIAGYFRPFNWTPQQLVKRNPKFYWLIVASPK